MEQVAKWNRWQSGTGDKVEQVAKWNRWQSGKELDSGTKGKNFSPRTGQSAFTSANSPVVD